MAYRITARADIKDTLAFYGQESYSAEKIIAIRSARDAQLAEVAPEASRVLRQLLLEPNTTAATDHPYVVGYMIQSGFLYRDIVGWNKRENSPCLIFPGPEKPLGPPYPMPEYSFPSCRCVCVCQPHCITVACPWDKVTVHQRIKHWYQGKLDFIDWVELICQSCNKTRAFIPEYMAEKDSIVESGPPPPCMNNAKDIEAWLTLPPEIPALYMTLRGDSVYLTKNPDTTTCTVWYHPKSGGKPYEF